MLAKQKIIAFMLSIFSLALLSPFLLASKVDAANVYNSKIQKQRVNWDGGSVNVKITGSQMLVKVHPDSWEYRGFWEWTVDRNIGYLTREYKDGKTYVYLNVDNWQRYYYQSVNCDYIFYYFKD
ncbi:MULTISPECIES: hypothetical protein [Brevibacillus]|uniref:hypothetical protein n=1 Tax=Brevibacillus TaxID=55080 RepID=UPI000B9B2C9B|nr:MULTISPECIES: hypothetical protein [Brevibacillus]MCG7317640.1 hypothetical protein [Brevibacillus laterosporus]MED1789071.1 hypothetical protein [Brevibacillus laterosporus]RFB34968.1 hypothetical protein DZB91_10590 [Brevibacillus sp. VP]